MRSSGRPQRRAARTGRDQMLAYTMTLLNSPSVKAVGNAVGSMVSSLVTGKTVETAEEESPDQSQASPPALKKSRRQLSRSKRADWTPEANDRKSILPDPVQALQKSLKTNESKKKKKK